MSPRRYAERTSVPADRSQGEIRSLLKKHGADRFAFAEGHDGAHIQFGLRGQQYRFTVDRPSTAEVKKHYATGSNQARLDAEWRRRWRARLLWLKASLEFAGDEGAEEIRRVLLANLLLRDGRTVAELIEADGLPLLGSGTN